MPSRVLTLGLCSCTLVQLEHVRLLEVGYVGLGEGLLLAALGGLCEVVEEVGLVLGLLGLAHGTVQTEWVVEGRRGRLELVLGTADGVGGVSRGETALGLEAVLWLDALLGEVEP